MQTIVYTYKDEERGWIVECEITATVLAYRPPTYLDPSEGGYVEDEQFEILSFAVKVGDYSHQVPLTDELKEALVNQLHESFPDFQDEVHQKMMIIMDDY